MNVHGLAARRDVRVGLLASVAMGWIVVVVGAAAERGGVVALGAVLAGAANVAAVKLALESRTAVAAVATDQRVLASEVARNRPSVSSRLDGLRRDVDAAVRSVADAERGGEAAVGRLVAGVDDTAMRAARLEAADKVVRARLVQLEAAHATTIEALTMTRSMVDKLASRVPSTFPPERLAALARQSVEHPLLSIAIPSFNRPDFLAECLASVEREIRGSFEDVVEVVIMDDASTDPDTIDVAAAFAERCSFGSVRRQQANVGIERNVIAACQPCRGDYILLLGNDDVMIPGSLTTMLTDLETVGAPVHVYEKTRITVDGLPRDAVPGSSPIDIPPGESHLFGSLLEAARRQGFISTFGFISHKVFRRAPFVAVDPTPYFDLTMYSQVFTLIEAFADSPVFYRNVPTVFHRTAPQTHKLVEAIGRREEVFMTGGPARRARYFGTTLAAAWQRLIDRTGFDPAFLLEQPEHLMSEPSLLSWIAQSRAIDAGIDGTLDPTVVADAERFLAAFHLEPTA